MEEHTVHLLIRATTRFEALVDAAQFVEDLHEYGYCTPHNTVTVDRVFMILGNEEPDLLLDRVAAARETRRVALRTAIARLHAKLESGTTVVRIDDLVTADTAVEAFAPVVSAIGDELVTIGSLIGERWHPECALYNGEMRHAGVRDDEMMTVQTNPKDWALVTIQVMETHAGI
ncbi:MAG: hypothetical protein PHR28_12125 [candidate division Zixibacteria bacterium]|jgi:hypothetical protein|nr:hypothetical protein [candidate division Zixibacteria bacterium]